MEKKLKGNGRLAYSLNKDGFEIIFYKDGSIFFGQDMGSTGKDTLAIKENEVAQVINEFNAFSEYRASMENALDYLELAECWKIVSRKGLTE